MHIILWTLRKAALFFCCPVVMGMGWVAFAPLSALAAGGSISGTVTIEDGMPAVGFIVTLFQNQGTTATPDWQPVQNTTTAATGAYSLTDLAAGEYLVLFEGSEFPQNYLAEFYDNTAVDNIESATRLVIGAAEAISEIDAQLVPGGRINGRVTDRAGTPLAQLWVTGWRSVTTVNGEAWFGAYSTETDAAGNYTLIGLEPDQYRVEFSDPNGIMNGEFYDNQPTLATATTLTVAANTTVSGINSTLARRGAIHGQVTDSSGAPLESIAVTAFHLITDTNGTVGYDFLRFTSTDANGVYQLEGLPAGGYRLAFGDERSPRRYRGEFYDDQATFDSAAIVNAHVDTITRNINAQLTAATLLHGTIRNTTGTVLPSMAVELFNYVDDGNGGQIWRSLATTFTDPQGHYEFPGLENGIFRLYVYDPQNPQRYLPEYYDNATTLESATDIVITAATLEWVIDVELANKGEIHGRVTAEEGQPLATILVKAYIPDPQHPEFWLAVASALTDQQGAYQIVGLEPNTYRVGFEEYEQPFRYVPEFYNNVLTLDTAQPIVVTAGQRVTAIDAALATASHLRGRLTAASGLVLSGQQVYVYAPSTNPQGVEAWVLDAVGITDSDGYYVAPVAPGRYRVGVTTVMGYLPEFYDGVDRVEEAADVIVAFGQSVDNINIMVDVAGSIQGTVTNEANQPLQAMRIEALQLVTPTSGIPVWQAIRTGFTNSDGTYSVEGLLPGRYRVRFSDGSTPRHYASEYYNNAASLADARWLELGRSAVITGIDAQLGLPNRMSGVVTDETGAPLADIEVQVWRQAPQANGASLSIPEEWVRSDADGHYQITGIDQGSYKVSFKSGELPPRYRQEFYDNVRSMAAGKILTFTTGMAVEAINAQLSAFAQNAAPLANADAILVTQGATAVTLTNGEASLLANDTDGDNDPLFFAGLLTLPQHGIAVMKDDGHFQYIHNGDSAITDFFTYQVSDGVATSTPATVTITIKPPVAIELTKTAWLAGVGTGCGGSAALRIPISTTVAYCYTLYNRGLITLTTHALVDDQLGTLLAGVPYTLAPGMRYQLVTTATVTAPITNTAIWTATPSAQAPFTLPITATATARVTFSSATDDQDADDIVDQREGIADPDQDGLPNFLDPDADGDWVGDRQEWGDNPTLPRDSNNDGLADYLDPRFPYNQQLQLPVILR